jgi:hypothetical protein
MFKALTNTQLKGAPKVLRLLRQTHEVYKQMQQQPGRCNRNLIMMMQPTPGLQPSHKQL